jgi:hypothetical protein
MNFAKTVEIVNNLLIDNGEWIIRYENYAEKITVNKLIHEAGRTKFRIFSPLYLYTNISNLLLINVLNYDLRFLGQSIAKIKIKNGIVKITTNRIKDSSNLKYFGIDTPLRDENWDSYKGKKIRSEFKKCKSIKGHSNEHKIESGLLSEFHSKSKSQKSLSNIQPVLLANSFFQMATPIKASLSEIIYSNDKGGGIDILSRVKHKNNSVRLCVMELKDEYSNSEPPQKVMNQAIAYATFIANLLRGSNNWYEIFGFSGNVPEVLIIDVSNVLPYPKKGEPEDFNKERVEILENTYIELYSLYFKEKSKFIDGYNYEFSGSLKEEMMK